MILHPFFYSNLIAPHFKSTHFDDAGQEIFTKVFNNTLENALDRQGWAALNQQFMVLLSLTRILKTATTTERWKDIQSGVSP